jgi:two-component system LytT family response regulator
MIRALLVDDEELARTRLRRLLAAFDDVAVVGEARDGEEALQRIVELRPQVVFLDIEMPGANGLEVVRSVAAPRPKIVFCTGYDQYAVEAFELHAADYLLKPVTRARLARSIERLRATPAADWDRAVEKVAGAAPAARFLARCGAKYRVVGQSEVEYIASEGGLSALHAGTGRFWLDPSLNTLEERLDPSQFFRISRAVIVRLEAVLEVSALIGGAGEIRLRSGARLTVSRRRFRELLARLEGRLTPGSRSAPGEAARTGRRGA